MAVQKSKPQNTAASTLIGVVLLAGILLVVWHTFTKSGPTPTTNSNQTRVGVAKYQVSPQNGSPSTDIQNWVNAAAAWSVNPADLHIIASVKNVGSAPGTPTCTIEARDNSGAYHGTDIVDSNKVLNSGDSSTLSDDITITSQGSQYVTTIQVDCQNK